MSLSVPLKRVSRLSTDRAVLFVCDLQERFRPIIDRFGSVVNRAVYLTQCCNTLEVPVIVSEQNPKALGTTVPELKAVFDASKTLTFEKKQFSMITPALTTGWNNLPKAGVVARDQVILCGIEAHVCVLQTTLDLVELGVEVHLVCDAISSQRPHDRAVALARLQAAGAHLTTAESLVFDLMRSAEHPQFKAISALTKGAQPSDYARDLTL